MPGPADKAQIPIPSPHTKLLWVNSVGFTGSDVFDWRQREPCSSPACRCDRCCTQLQGAQSWVRHTQEPCRAEGTPEKSSWEPPHLLTDNVLVSPSLQKSKFGFFVGLALAHPLTQLGPGLPPRPRWHKGQKCELMAFLFTSPGVSVPKGEPWAAHPEVFPHPCLLPLPAHHPA